MQHAEQQVLPGVESGPVIVVSPSSLERYRHCPRLYRFLYVDGLWNQVRTSPEQSFGTSVHAALREFFRLPAARRSLDVLLDLFRKGWVREGYRDREHADRERERGLAALRAWYERADTDLVPYATELGLQAVFGDVVLKGRLDRVDTAPEGGLTVIDYKTGRRPATQEEADADEALTVYTALAERRLGRQVTGLVLDYVVAGRRVATERPPQVLRERLDRVLELAATMRDDRVYQPRTGPWCSRCDLLGRCPDGQRQLGQAGAKQTIR
jgi:putative RecB family exonuclease